MATTALRTVLQTLRRSLLLQDRVGCTDGELLECFIGHRDQTAFEALLQRHGPMVLGVCRRVLDNEADTEDAFQATFLVLVRKAASIRPRGIVGNWLYGVAHSTALKARAMRSKRSAKEREAVALRRPDPSDTWHELEARLDQELKVLPDKYRAVIVLCDLEGKSLKEAARQLGCPLGTIGTRLARGRALLARRLTRQGLALSPGTLAVVLSQNASAAVPAALAATTGQAAALYATGAVATGLISANVAALTKAGVNRILLTKLKIATAILMLLVTAGIHDDPRGTEPIYAVSMTEKARSLRTDEDQQLASIVVSVEPSGKQTPDGTVRRDPKKKQADKIGRTATAAEVPKDPKATGSKELPPGLAKKPANHPGRVAWLKSHG